MDRPTSLTRPIERCAPDNPTRSGNPTPGREEGPVAADTGPVDAAQAVRLALLALLVAVEAVWILTLGSLDGGIRWVPILGAVALHLWLVVWEARRPVLGAGVVVAASALVVVVAVAVAPFGSQDLYLYAIYGRMVTEHDLNPYLVGPDAVKGDALYAWVASPWRTSPTAYGPAFTAWSAVGAAVYGDSPLRARLFFQGSAGAALLAAAWYLHRRGRSSATLIAVGLSPVLVATVQGGHNDIIAGVLVLVGIDLVARRRTVGGAFLVALACAVKLLLAPVALVAVLVPALGRRWGDAGRAAGVMGGVLAASYLVVGGTAALEPLRDLNQIGSRSSLWGALSLLVPGADELLWGDGWARPLALVLVGLCCALIVWRAPRPVDAVALATALAVVVCFAADYTLPWYAAAFLPLAALGTPSVARWALTIGATTLLLVYLQPPGAPMSELVFSSWAARIGGVVLGLMVVWTVVAVTWPRSGRTRTRPDPEPDTDGGVRSRSVRSA